MRRKWIFQEINSSGSDDTDISPSDDEGFTLESYHQISKRSRKSRKKPPPGWYIAGDPTCIWNAPTTTGASVTTSLNSSSDVVPAQVSVTENLNPEPNGEIPATKNPLFGYYSDFQQQQRQQQQQQQQLQPLSTLSAMAVIP